MKRLIVIILILAIGYFAYGESIVQQSPDRELVSDVVLEGCNLGLRITNFARFGRQPEISQGLIWPNLPGQGQVDYLFCGALWIGGQKNRRNGLGEQLYWLPNASSEYDVVTENEEEWTPDLERVVDTLVSVGFDGDMELMELLPAYYPLEVLYIDIFEQYNESDQVMHVIGQLANVDDDEDEMIDEDDPGRLFQVDDSFGTWCFTTPYDDDGDGFIDEDSSLLGVENTVSYFYDYSPFESIVERDWGSAESFSSHVPLGIAVEQQTWSYPIMGLEDIVFINWKIHNTTEDTLRYLSYGLYIDADIGPLDWNSIGVDDVSTYDTENEYPYSYDFDGDDGNAPGKIAAKLLNCDYGFACWTWSVGDGPDDSDPQSFDPPSGATSHNDKYWLMTEIDNPNEEDYISLRDYPNSQIPSEGLDTRFLYSTYGAMPHTGDRDNNGILDYLETDDQGDYFKRNDLNPLDNVDITAILFMGTSEDDLDARYNEALELYNSGFDLSSYVGVPSVPLIKSLGMNNHLVEMKWNCFTIPETLWVKYKQVDAPAADWNYIELDPLSTSYTFTEITEADYYEFQVACSFLQGVYLESQKKTFFFDPSLANGENDITPTNQKLWNYPNPFNPQTTISWQQEKAGSAEIDIFNIQGQKVKTFRVDHSPSGENKIIWNGVSDAGKECSSGVYLIRLKADNAYYQSKAILLK